MSYQIRGTLLGAVCDECREPLTGLEVRAYQATGEQTIASAVASEKETFRARNDDEHLDAPLAIGRIDEGGGYVLELDSKTYDGGALEIDLYCATPPRPKVGPNPTPRQFAITTLQPRWREAEQGSVAVWDYCIPARFWCYILSLFGIWTISGHLTTCEGQQPIPGATVRAFDADWLQDDALGSATTDAAGHFLITYLTADFRRTPFSPLINIEFTEGPDVYFKAELGGHQILTESQSAGRVPGRENVGPCLCVDLCTDEVIGTPETTPHWQQVEVFAIHPAPGQPGSSFDTVGYADPAGGAYVFGGEVTLRGNCPLVDIGSGHSLQYRFLIGEYTWTSSPDDPTTMPSVAPAMMQPVRQIGNTLVGYVFYSDGNSMQQSAPVVVTPADVAADGWVQVDGKPVTVPMYNPPNSTAIVTVNTSNFLRTFDLLVLNTPAITSSHPVKKPGGLSKSQAGSSLALTEQEPVRRYRLAFEVRDGVTAGPALYSDQLSTIVLDNSSVIAALDLEELRVNACNPLAGANTIHLLYTVDHPHLRNFSISIGSNGGTVHAPPQTPEAHFSAGGYFFRGGASGPHNGTNTGGFPLDVHLDAPCAYAVNLGWITRRWGDLGQSTLRLYCR
jgi:hypothetical protein